MSDQWIYTVLYRGEDGKVHATPEMSSQDCVRHVAQAYRAAGVEVVREGSFVPKLLELGLWIRR